MNAFASLAVLASLSMGLAFASGHAHAQHENGALLGAPQAAYAPSGSTSLADAPVWKRITLGTHKGVGGLRRAFEAAGMRLGDSADEILGRPAFHFTQARGDVDLVVVSVSDLGFEKGAPLADIHRRAVELGLELCPADAAPTLRLVYIDQPVGEFLNVAMRPVATYAGEQIVLSVANAGTGPLLLGGDGRPEMRMSPRARFVFVRPARIALPNLR